MPCPECNDRAAQQVRAELYPGVVQGSPADQIYAALEEICTKNVPVTREEYEALLRRVVALEKISAVTGELLEEIVLDLKGKVR